MSFLSSLTNCVNLTSIVVADNPLNGTLSLDNNELIGPIPTIVGNLGNLQGLFLQNNRIHGSIPNDTCHLRNLVELHLNQNELFGSIPTCWGSLSSLRTPYLDSNQLTSIPSSFWSLRDMLRINFVIQFFKWLSTIRCWEIGACNKNGLIME